MLDVSPKSKARAKMYEESQREGERMSDFATRVAEKALIAYDDEQMRRTVQLDVFVMGVRDNEIGRDLLKAKHAHFDAAVEHAIELEAIYDSRKDDTGEALYNVAEAGNPPAQREPRREADRKRVRCFNCGKNGHFSRE